MDDVLVIQLARTGDFLQTTPLLGSLKADRSTGRLSVLIDKRVEDAARHCPDIDYIYTIDSDEIYRGLQEPDRCAARLYEVTDTVSSFLRHMRFDHIINVNCSMLSALCGTLPECRRISGYYISPKKRRLIKDPFCHFFTTAVETDRLAPFNLVDCFCLMCGQGIQNDSPMKYRTENVEKELAQRMLELLGISGGDIVVGLQLGTGHHLRQWPTVHFARCALELTKHERVKCLLLGTDQDKRTAEEVLGYTGSRVEGQQKNRILDLTGKTTLPQLAALLERSCLLITGDTGAMHLGASVGCPQLVLFFGPAYVHHTGPYYPDSVVMSTSVECSPCSENNEECTGARCSESLDPVTVAQTAMSMLLDKPLPEADSGAAEMYRPQYDSFGMVYTPFRQRPPSLREIRNLCYRHMGSMLHQSICSNGGGSNQDCASSTFHWNDTDFIDHDTQIAVTEWIGAGLLLLERSYSSFEDCLLETFNDRMSFWRPWVHCCNGIITDHAECTKTANHWSSIMHRGIRSAVEYLNGYILTGNGPALHRGKEFTTHVFH